ncbi:MAG: hypothetical protein LUH53_06915 [Lachnospiraceae bacterium]|nr:hypothetical protein [Lachnospiraceae bacterium]
MLDIQSKTDYYGLNDWKINLIIPNELTNEDVAKFNSDLGKALIYIKNMGDPDMIEKLSVDERFRVLKTDTVLLLNEVMNADFAISPESEVTTDMCYAVEKIKEKAAILSAIETARIYGVSESAILADIEKRFKLTVEEAKAYMALQPA